MSFGLGVSFGRWCNMRRPIYADEPGTTRWETEESVWWQKPDGSIYGYNKKAMDLLHIQNGPTLLPHGECEPFMIDNKWTKP